MPASVTLTVSHLPTSTSFFLSSLQPLDYVYRGRSNNTIGFGSSTEPSAPTDFWITQETPGVPAGAAHVAFSAPSRKSVQYFFTAALKAGGKIHGEPALRDCNGYYSAAVIDFDGNSIEAVHRPSRFDVKEDDVQSAYSTARSEGKPLSEVRSSYSRVPASEVKTSAPRETAPSQTSTSQKASGDFFGNIFAEARNAANMARNVVEQTRPLETTSLGQVVGNNDSTIVGTLLGVAAGAALHYAFSQTIDGGRRPSATRSITEPVLYPQYVTYRALEPVAASQYSTSPRSITLEDNEYSIYPAKSQHHHNRRNSGSVISTGFGYGGEDIAYRNASRTKMIEAAPRSSYSSYTGSKASRRSVSDPLPPLNRTSSHHSGRSVKTTILTTHEEARGPNNSSYPPPSFASKSRDSSSARPYREPESYPLPPSIVRASTWQGSSTSSAKREKSVSGNTSSSSSRHGSKHHHSRSKHSTHSSKFASKQSVMDEELTPDDSISQISVNSDRTIKAGGSHRH